MLRLVLLSLDCLCPSAFVILDLLDYVGCPEGQQPPPPSQVSGRSGPGPRLPDTAGWAVVLWGYWGTNNDACYVVFTVCWALFSALSQSNSLNLHNNPMS